MAQRTIQSPGTEISERDLSLRAPQNVGTNIFIAGFANKGYTDEVVQITTQEELDNIYGTPTNAAERYFYYSVKELLNSPATIYTFRLPYGLGSGDGFGSKHSALVYPVVSYYQPTSSLTTNLNLSAGTYVLGQPIHMTISDEQYREALEGTLFDWSETALKSESITSVSDLGKAGIIVLDKAQTTINSQFEGFYVGIADNTNINPANAFDSIRNLKTLSDSTTAVGSGTAYTSVPAGTLTFQLSAEFGGTANSISEIMENLTPYNIDGREDDDLLNVGVFKIRKSIYASEAFKLDYVLDDAIVGSIDTHRTQLNPLGGPSLPFFLEVQDTNSRNVEILVNPYISNRFTESSLDENGNPKKKIRVYTPGLTATSLEKTGIHTHIWSASANVLSGLGGFADSLYPLGAFSNQTIQGKLVGNIPTKVERALDSVKNDEIYDIDVVPEAGLGTIFAMACAAETYYYDDTLYNSTIKPKVDSMRTSNSIEGDTDAEGVRANYSAVFDKFENFCNLPNQTGGRGDCFFIADPIRHFLITGRGGKVLSDKTKNFQTHVYWPIRHQFELQNTSYAATYANWVLGYDDFTGEKVWLPFSGYGAAAFAKNDSDEFPWFAPAGFNRGLLTTALDIAVNPNQKQRDELYKASINPVMFSPSQGMVIFGQKTMYRKPSAFDRINVRRLFLALERPAKKAAQYFVFEPNDEFTRTRLVNTITPIFEFAKQNRGLYDYYIVCDERNNTPEVIDNNELKVDIYLKPTRTAEFILISFIATRTDANFEELV